MSSQSETIPAVPKTPFFAAAALFLGVAGLIGALAIRPLGAAELIGLLACVAAATVFATIPFVIDTTRRLDAARHHPHSEKPTPQQPPETCHQSGDKSGLDTDALVERITAAVEARLDASLETRLAAALPEFREQLSATLSSALTASLAAAEETRRAEIQAAIAATTPPRALDADNIAPPAAASTGAAGKPRLGRGLLGLMHAPAALAAKTVAPSSGDTREPATDDDRAAA